jgi:hypothetical protein
MRGLTAHSVFEEPALEFCLGKDLVVENPADLARLGQNTWWCGEAYTGRRLRFTVA